MHSAEKVCDNTLDDENSSQHVTSVLVAALSNQRLHYIFIYSYFVTSYYSIVLFDLVH